MSPKVHDKKVHDQKIHMHQTTVRFGQDLWEVLEREAERLGVSAAQYIRDATLTRLAYAAARQEEAVASRDAFAWAGEASLGTGTPAPATHHDAQAPVAGAPEAPPAVGARAALQERVEAQLEGAAAVQAQSELARGRAERLRLEAQELQRRREAGRKR